MDQECDTTFEYLPGKLNTGADGLSHHEILEETPKDILQEVCEVSALDGDINETYPVSMNMIQKY